MAFVGQSKKHSLLESFINIAVGIGISFAAQLLFFPLFGIHIPISDNLLLTLIFTVISIVRSYSLRRLFNYMHTKSYL